MDNITKLLEKQGYHVVDMQEASKPGLKVDAFLFTSNHPDIVTSYNNLSNAADVSLALETPQQDSSVNTIMLNITGMSPQEAVQELEHRLAQKNS
jgi:ABC-type molybdate transport system ATPase subunit